MKEEEILQLVRERMKDRPKIVSMFENCYQDTLEKTIIRQEDGQVFMLTGDIPRWEFWNCMEAADGTTYISVYSDSVLVEVLRGREKYPVKRYCKLSKGIQDTLRSAASFHLFS